jgi:hypothetical protein
MLPLPWDGLNVSREVAQSDRSGPKQLSLQLFYIGVDDVNYWMGKWIFTGMTRRKDTS